MNRPRTPECPKCHNTATELLCQKANWRDQWGCNTCGHTFYADAPNKPKNEDASGRA